MPWFLPSMRARTGERAAIIGSSFATASARCGRANGTRSASSSTMRREQSGAAPAFPDHRRCVCISAEIADFQPSWLEFSPTRKRPRPCCSVKLETGRSTAAVIHHMLLRPNRSATGRGGQWQVVQSNIQTRSLGPNRSCVNSKANPPKERCVLCSNVTGRTF